MKTQKIRRRKNRTDYLKRLNLLKSERPRVVFRKTNRYVITQYVTSSEAKDKIELGINSKQLLKYGWPKEAQGSLKSLTASYFTGFLMGKKIKEKNMDAPIIDFGMARVLHKTKVFAFMKGLVDAEVGIKYDEGTFPDEKKIKGENLKNKIPFDEIKQNIEKNG